MDSGRSLRQWLSECCVIKHTMFDNSSEGAEMFGNELKELLETLFDDYDESTSEDITVLKSYVSPFGMLTACCTYSYAAYSR